MRTLTTSFRSTLAVVLLVPFLVLTWGLAVPDGLTPLGYMLIAVLFTGFSAVVLVTYRNAQATGSVAHILKEAEVCASPVARGVRPAASHARLQV